MIVILFIFNLQSSDEDSKRPRGLSWVASDNLKPFSVPLESTNSVSESSWVKLRLVRHPVSPQFVLPAFPIEPHWLAIFKDKVLTKLYGKLRSDESNAAYFLRCRVVDSTRVWVHEDAVRLEWHCQKVSGVAIAQNLAILSTAQHMRVNKWLVVAPDEVSLTSARGDVWEGWQISVCWVDSQSAEEKVQEFLFWKFNLLYFRVLLFWSILLLTRALDAAWSQFIFIKLKNQWQSFIACHQNAPLVCQMFGITYINVLQVNYSRVLTLCYL